MGSSQVEEAVANLQLAVVCCVHEACLEHQFQALPSTAFDCLEHQFQTLPSTAFDVGSLCLRRMCFHVFAETVSTLLVDKVRCELLTLLEDMAAASAAVADESAPS